MEEEWNNLYLHSLDYKVKTYCYTLFYTVKTYCYTLFNTLILSFTPVNYTLIRNSTLNKGGSNGVKILFLHSLHSFPRYFSAKSSARKPSRKHAVVWSDAINESINIFIYCSVGDISRWFKKKSTLEIFPLWFGCVSRLLISTGLGTGYGGVMNIQPL